MSGYWSGLLAAAGEGLLGAKLRSALAVLGLVVGAAAVVVMMAAGQGARIKTLERIGALGSHLITVRTAKRSFGGARGGGGRQVPALNPGDADALRRLDGVDQAVAWFTRSLPASAKGVATQTTILAATPEIFALQDHLPAQGRLYTSREESGAKRVAVLGPSLRDKLAGAESLVGSRIEIKKQSFLVVGELQAKGTGPDGEDLDDRVYLPLKTGLKRLGIKRRQVDFITVEAAPDRGLNQLGGEIRAFLLKRHPQRNRTGKQVYSIRNQDETIAAEEEANRLFSALMTGVASLAILVAGVGILAVLLIGVGERTAEIGVRRAVGARKRDIRRLFMLEGSILGLAGGGLGALLGLGAAAALRPVLDLPYNLPWAPALLAGLFCLGVSALFSLWPAAKAANLDPARALVKA